MPPVRTADPPKRGLRRAECNPFANKSPNSRPAKKGIKTGGGGGVSGHGSPNSRPAKKGIKTGIAYQSLEELGPNSRPAKKGIKTLLSSVITLMVWVRTADPPKRGLRLDDAQSSILRVRSEQQTRQKGD